MSIICLSLTPILRCNGLSPTFASTLLIPPGLAVLISTALFFTRKNDKKRLLLVGEGLAYFILAVLDFVSKVIPTIHLSLDMFKGLDVTVGALSDIPIALYCLFLLLLVRAALVKGLPPMMQRVFYMLFLCALPTLLIVNACASFVGVSYTSLTIGDSDRPTVGVRMSPGHSADMWHFLSGWAAALLGFIQFLVFFLTFARIVRPPKTFGKYSALGLYLIAAGVLFGAIECMVGFAPGTTTVVFVRRSFHSLARALVVVGVVLGVDEDAVPETTSVQSSLRSRIGSPEPGSLVHVSGEGESILEKPMQSVQVDPAVQLQRTQTIIQDMKNATFNPFEPRTPPIPITPGMLFPQDQQNPFADGPAVIVQDQDTGHSPSVASSAHFRRSADSSRLPTPVFATGTRPPISDRSAQRVTLHYDSTSGQAPHLEMRLSTLDLPSPGAVIASLRRFDSLRPSSDPTVNGALNSAPRLPRTATMAGSLAQLRQQYADEVLRSGDMWYPFRGSPTRQARACTHTQNRSSLGSFSIATDIEAGDPASDPKPASQRHSRARTIGGSSDHNSRGRLSAVSGVSYMSDASDFVKDLAPRFPDIPPMPVPSRAVSALGPPSTPLEPGALVHSPFANPNDETEEDAARAIRGPRTLPALDTAVVPTPHTFGFSPAALSADEVPSAGSTRHMGALDVPMSALDAPEFVEVPGSARPRATQGISRTDKPAGLVQIRSGAHRSTVVTPATAGRSSVPIEHFVFDLRTNKATAAERMSTLSAYTVASPVGFHAE